MFVEKATGNTVGPNNEISGNDRGVAVAFGAGNYVTRNSIFDNAFGIDLVAVGDPESGETENDATDADEGANHLMNYPEILGIQQDGNVTTVFGTARPGATVEVFRTDIAPPARGQGETFLFSDTAAADGSFSGSFNVEVPLTEAFFITATASLLEVPTDILPSTSEFSPSFALTQIVDIPFDAIAFGTVSLGFNATRDVSICNVGVANLTITSVTVEGDPEFTVVPPATTVVPPGTCVTATVNFNPTSAGSFAGTLVIVTDDPTNPEIRIPITGSAVNPSISIDLAAITIPVTRIGSSRQASVRVTNTAAAPIQITDVRIDRIAKKSVSFTNTEDPFFTATPTAASLAPNQSVDIVVTFSPDFPQEIPNLSNDGPFVFPDPGYVLTKGLKDTMTIQVNGGIVTRAVSIKAKVPDDPWILGGHCTLRTDDRDHLFVDPLTVFDPDGNITDATWRFFNAQNVLLSEVTSTPNLAKRIRKYPPGVVVSFDLVFSGFAPFFDSFNYFTVQLTDAKGNKSNVGTCDLDNQKQRTGSVVIQGPRPSAAPRTAVGEPLDIVLGPRN